MHMRVVDGIVRAIDNSLPLLSFFDNVFDFKNVFGLLVINVLDLLQLHQHRRLETLDETHQVRNVIFNFLKLTGLIILLLLQEGCDDVLDLPVVRDSLVQKLPVIHDKAKVILDLLLVLNFVVFSEGLAHDGDQHVQQMDQDEKTCENSDDY